MIESTLTISFIGIVVGLVMGLTGAGGALISIPLFINLMGMTLKEATVISLVAVIFGTSIHLAGQFSKIDKKVVLYFFIFGGIANFLSLGIKKIVPEVAIATLLTLIVLFSIRSIWNNNSEAVNSVVAPGGEVKKSISTGLLIGFITTLTGLGGGVLLIPILMKFFGKNYEEALPTSLGTIFLVSLTSFLLQLSSGIERISSGEIILIGVGVIVSYFILKVGLKGIAAQTINYIRKWTFTLVSLYSVGIIILKSF